MTSIKRLKHEEQAKKTKKKMKEKKNDAVGTDPKSTR